ncbi:MAG: hypothetical protein RIQ97_1906 [Pseudomonadota bacterium]
MRAKFSSAVGTARIPAWMNQAIVLHQWGDLAGAEALYRQVLHLAPRHFDALHMMGALALQRQQPAQALPWLRRALMVRENDDALHFHLALALSAQAQWPQALTHIQRSLALQHTSAASWDQQAKILQALGRDEEALLSIARAQTLDPQNADLPYHEACMRADRLDYVQALVAIDRAITLRPDFANARWNRAFWLLLLGRYAEAWDDYEWRWQADLKLNHVQTSKPRWDGHTSLQGKTLFLHGEQGLGDTLQFCRYVPLLIEAGAKVVMGVQPALEELLDTLPGGPHVLRVGETIPPFDAICHIMSLGRVMGTTLESIPAQVPYLRANPAKRAIWRERLGPRTRPRWGLAWSGNPTHANDHQRSMALAEVLPHLRPDIEWISMQPVVRERDQAHLAQSPIRPLGAQLQNFDDTAALCAELDGVISVDTSVAHLAGALGKPLKVLVPRHTDWRWLLGRQDSPWYPSATLYRMGDDGDWTPVLRQVMAQLPAA